MLQAHERINTTGRGKKQRCQPSSKYSLGEEFETIMTNNDDGDGGGGDDEEEINKQK